MTATTYLIDPNTPPLKSATLRQEATKAGEAMIVQLLEAYPELSRVVSPPPREPDEDERKWRAKLAPLEARDAKLAAEETEAARALAEAQDAYAEETGTAAAVTQAREVLATIQEARANVGRKAASLRSQLDERSRTRDAAERSERARQVKLATARFASAKWEELNTIRAKTVAEFLEGVRQFLAVRLIAHAAQQAANGYIAADPEWNPNDPSSGSAYVARLMEEGIDVGALVAEFLPRSLGEPPVGPLQRHVVPPKMPHLNDAAYYFDRIILAQGML